MRKVTVKSFKSKYKYCPANYKVFCSEDYHAKCPPRPKFCLLCFLQVTLGKRNGPQYKNQEPILKCLKSIKRQIILMGHILLRNHIPLFFVPSHIIWIAPPQGISGGYFKTISNLGTILNDNFPLFRTREGNFLPSSQVQLRSPSSSSESLKCKLCK